MPYFKDESNMLHFLESEDDTHLLPEGCILITDAEAAAIQSPTADQAKAAKWEAIKAERDHRKAAGVKVGTKWFHSDDASRIQQMGLVMMGANIPAGLQWKTLDGSFVDMTAALAQQVFTAIAASDQAIFAAAEAHRMAMESSPSPMDYDFSAGWPKTFGE